MRLSHTALYIEAALASAAAAAWMAAVHVVHVDDTPPHDAQRAQTPPQTQASPDSKTPRTSQVTTVTAAETQSQRPAGPRHLSSPIPPMKELL